MIHLTVDRETFAADRRRLLESHDGPLAEAASQALVDWGSDGWWEPLVEAALAVFDEVATAEGAEPGQVLDDFRATYAESLGERLRETTEPASPPDPAQVERLSMWLSTASVNAGTAAAAATDPEPLSLEWVTMKDEVVRGTHRAADGQTIPLGATFDIGGYDLHYPGEPVGPPAIWINCRCVVRVGEGGNMDEEALIAAAEAAIDEPVDTEAPEITDDDLDVDVPWYGVLAPEGVPTGDRRMFQPGSLRYRDLPLPLRYMPADAEGHDGSYVVGRIDNIWLEDGLHKAEGVFHRSVEAERVVDLLANRMVRGVSVDLDDSTFEMQNEDGSAFDMETATPEDRPMMVATSARIASAAICAIPAYQEAFVAIGRWEDMDATQREVPSDEVLVASGECTACEEAALIGENSTEHAEQFASLIEAGEEFPEEFVAEDGTRYVFSEQGVQVFAPGTKDGPGWITHPVPTARIRRYWVRGKGAAKIRWGVPGDFNRCRRQLAKYVKNPDWLAGLCANMHKEALGVWPGQEGGGRGRHSVEGEAAPAFSLVASAGRVLPGAWFGDPNLHAPTPVTVTEEGQVYGHVAAWGTCHIGLPGGCTTPPHSATGYAYFRTGTIDTDLGRVAVGQITMGTGHAALNANPRKAAEHYDHTGAAVADVAVGEDEHGIWIAGAMREGVPEAQVQALRASGALSGDWRKIGMNYEMVAALAVNVPGFPLPRLSIAASGSEQTALVASGVVTESKGLSLGTATVTVTVDGVREALAQIAAEDARAARLSAVKAEARAQRLAGIRKGIG